MHRCRLYLPLDGDHVRALVAGEQIRPGPVFAVTEWLERAHPSEDEEGLEYLALVAAREAAVTRRDGSGRPLVVAAADVGSDEVDLTPATGGGSPARVGLRVSVPLRQVVAFHVEEPPAGSRAEPDLLWYDVTELDEVARLSGA